MDPPTKIQNDIKPINEIAIQTDDIENQNNGSDNQTIGSKRRRSASLNIVQNNESNSKPKNRPTLQIANQSNYTIEADDMMIANADNEILSIGSDVSDDNSRMAIDDKNEEILTQLFSSFKPFEENDTVDTESQLNVMLVFAMMH